MIFEWDAVWKTTTEGGGHATNVMLDDGLITWHDLTHCRAYVVKEVTKDTPEEFRFTDKQGRKHWLKLVTDAKVIKKVRRMIASAYGVMAEI